MANNIFGLSEHALQLSEDRAVLLTNNISNSSTPNYKARDIDYQKILKQLAESTAAGKAVTSTEVKDKESIMFRVPMQKSQDGNTVDDDIERKNFIENAINYQVNLTFVQNKTDELLKAIKGE